MQSSPPPLDALSQEYVALAFAIERLVPGYVDAYFGPLGIKESALAGDPPAARTLVERGHALAARVASGGCAAERTRYLAAQVRAMLATSRRLAGEELSYLGEVRHCFDVEPERTPEVVFNDAIAELDELLPGEGDVHTRMIAWRATYEVSPETARTMIDVIANETRRRTAAFVDLPPGEAVEFAFVTNQPWSGYNWYLGDARSRVDVNTDNPIRAHELPGLLAHEVYPGHHTEHALKEQYLYRERGYGEHAIQLINTPECVISEGIATLAESVIYTPEELAAWLAETVYPAAGVTGDPAREAAVHRAQRALRPVSANAALLLHHEGATEKEVVAYLMRYGLRPEKEARHSLDFIRDPLWRAYIFTYHAGHDLLGRWLDAAPAVERQARFRTLLTEQIAPSRVREWIAAEAND
ncbi:MAG: hypothetical protein ACRDJH_20010 [Thermomicrobiales bacterium]